MGVRQGCTMSPWLFNLVVDTSEGEGDVSGWGAVRKE